MVARGGPPPGPDHWRARSAVRTGLAGIPRIARRLSPRRDRVHRAPVERAHAEPNREGTACARAVRGVPGVRGHARRDGRRRALQEARALRGRIARRRPLRRRRSRRRPRRLPRAGPRADPTRDDVVGTALGPRPRDDRRQRAHDPRLRAAHRRSGADAHGVRADRQPRGRGDRAARGPALRLSRRPQAGGDHRRQRRRRRVGDDAAGGILRVARARAARARAAHADPRGTPGVP